MWQLRNLTKSEPAIVNTSGSFGIDNGDFIDEDPVLRETRVGSMSVGSMSASSEFRTRKATIVSTWPNTAAYNRNEVWLSPPS